jgi:chitinase
MILRFRSIGRLAPVVFVGLIVILVAPLAAAQKANAHHLPKRIVGDYTYGAKFLNPPYSAAQIPYRKLTHIIHAGVPFNADGTLSVPDGFLEPELINLAHAHGVKVLLLTGGDFAGVETSGTIGTLVESIKAFVSEHGYDGVDVDWEYPASPEDVRFEVELMARLRRANPEYTLSIDVAPWGYPYDLKHLQLSLDFFNIMMYDCAGPWTAYGQLNSPIFWDKHDPAPWECQPGGSVEQTANIFLKHVPAEQLNMGTPFYGYHYTNIHQLFGLCPNSAYTADGACDDTVQTMNYGPDLKRLINKHGWKTYYDPISFVPYMLKANGSNGYITYDDPFSTYFRVWYADWGRGLGGTFMWSLDADYDGHSQDLLDAMYLATKGRER